MDPLIVSKAANGAILLLSQPSLGEDDFVGLRDDLRDWGIPLIGAVHNFGGTRRVLGSAQHPRPLTGIHP